MTTVSELLNHDFKENGYIHHRYWKASSLPIGERHKARPIPRKHRRDRVMKEILRRDAQRTLRLLVGSGFLSKVNSRRAYGRNEKAV